MKKDMLLDVNMSHGKMSDFVSFSMLGFTLVITLRNFDYWNSSNFLDKKKMMWDLIMSSETVSDLV